MWLPCYRGNFTTLLSFWLRRAKLFTHLFWCQTVNDEEFRLLSALIRIGNRHVGAFDFWFIELHAGKNTSCLTKVNQILTRRFP